MFSPKKQTKFSEEALQENGIWSGNFTHILLLNDESLAQKTSTLLKSYP